jgi:hypothetical protein
MARRGFRMGKPINCATRRPDTSHEEQYWHDNMGLCFGDSSAAQMNGALAHRHVYL